MDKMSIFNTRCVEALDELGYLPLTSNIDDMLHESIIRSLESLGKTTCNALVDNLCSISKLSERELLTNFDIFEGSLRVIIGRYADHVVRIIKREILAIAIASSKCDLSSKQILDTSLEVSTILENIRTREVLDFILHSDHSHIAFIYKNQGVKTRLNLELKNFRDCNRGRRSLPTKIADKKIPSIFNFSLDKLFLKESLKEELIKKQIDRYVTNRNLDHEFVAGVMPVRDRSLRLKNNLMSALVSAEHFIEKETKHNDSSFICCFDCSNTAQMTPSLIKSIISHHKYVIIEEPILTIYRSKS